MKDNCINIKNFQIIFFNNNEANFVTKVSEMISSKPYVPNIFTEMIKLTKENSNLKDGEAFIKAATNNKDANYFIKSEQKAEESK